MSGEKTTAMCAVGEILSHYCILEKIGSGGMGDVFRARDEHLDRDVAIKVLPPKTFAVEAARKHFRKEAVTLSKLNHPNIATIHDFDTHAGIDFLVMEYIPGINLSEELALGPLAEKEVVNLGIQLAEGLSALHEYGVIHRDLKPGNLRLTRGGRLKILDFGLAMLHRSITENTTTESTSEAIAGTLLYMAPEQLLGREADARTDIHAAGCVLYEMITGQQPFAEVGHSQLIAAMLQRSPVVRDSCISFELKRIIGKCLEKDPESRYQSTKELLIDLRRLQAGTITPSAEAPAESLVRRRLMPKLLAVVASALILLGVGLIVLRKAIAPPLTPSYQQLTFRRGTVISAKFASNGQIIYSAAWDGNPPELFMTSKESHASTSIGIRNADIQSISKSGELLVVSNRTPVGGFVRPGTLSRAPLSGSAPRPVLENVQDADWAPDGSNIVVARLVGRRFHLEYPIGKVLYETDGWIGKPHVSPSGDSVAFLDYPFFGDDHGAVAIVDLKGHKRTLSPEHDGTQGLAWTPDGEELWFSVASTGSEEDLYGVDLEGNVRSISRGPGGFHLLDIGRDGSVIMAQGHTRRVAMVSGSGQPGEHDLAVAGWTINRDITSNGSAVLLDEGAEGSPNDIYSVYLRKTDGSPPVRLGDGIAWKLSPDGQWALVSSQVAPRQLMLLPTGTGQPRTITHDNVTHIDGCWLPDSKKVAYLGQDSSGKRQIYLSSLDGSLFLVLEVKRTTDPPLLCSPDAKSIAAKDESGAWLIPLDGGQQHKISGTEPGDSPIQWSNDARALYVARFPPMYVTPYAKLFRVDVNSGKREFLKNFTPTDPAGVSDIRPLQITPDLRFYSYGFGRYLTDMYSVEGLK